MVACNNTPKNEPMTKKHSGLHLEYMDKSVRPQDDFYQFVNGNWNKKAKIPSDRSRWGAFSELRKRTDSAMIDLVEKYKDAGKFAVNSDEGKALEFYKAVLDTATRNAEGIKPLLPYLDQAEKVHSVASLTAYLDSLQPALTSPFLGIYIGPHMRNSRINALYLGAGSLGLPDRDYYVSDSPDMKKIREQYKAHIRRMWRFIPGTDEKEAAKSADNVLQVETALATAMLTKEERRKPENRYNPRTIVQLEKEVPGFAWKKYFEGLGIKTDSLILTQPKYLSAFRQILDQGNWEAVRDYLKWTLLRGSAGKLSEEIERANWEFYGKTLNGTPEQRPLKERALATTNAYLGEALGKIYVKEVFPPEAKQKAKELVGYLQKAYIRRIKALPWMQPETKEKAIEKVKALTVKIGYPDKWKDYSALHIIPVSQGGTYFKNSMQYNRWHFERQVKKLGKEPDRTEWGMSPQTVNAYYNPSYNEIVFPAAILQSPFFDFQADDAVNFGGIGAVIGHEISHGFDDQGAKYDAEGNFHLWWKKEDFETFNKLGKKLADQYSKIEVLPGVFINGEFTLGENIGDLGGVNAAFTALQMYWKDHGKPGEMDGFTPEQRYFISWASVWRTKIRPEALKQQIKTDPHSPGQVRAYQPIRNMEEFRRAFDIKPGDKMYLSPEESVKIW